MTDPYMKRYALIIALMLTHGASLAAVITVDGVKCTLVDAITAANTDNAVAGCTTGNLADTLNLTAPVFNIAAVNNDTDGPNGLPSVKTTITINGRGAIIQRGDGAPGFRLFHVASSGNLTLNRATVRNGLAVAQSTLITGKGGGIYNRGVVRLINRSVLQDNSATRTACCVSRGGGIFNVAGASLTITNSTVAANDATLGGGSNNQGSLTVINSTISHNNANEGGGLNNQGSLTVINSTVSHNNAGLGTRLGGGLYNAGDSTLWHATLTNNSAGQGGGVYNENTGSLQLNNTLIANSSEGTDCNNNSGNILFKGINLIEDGTCNVVAEGGLAVDPKLRSLLDNGGATKTRALRANSPAKNTAGSGFCRLIDQRRASRPQGAKCDIGAFELVLTAHSSVQSIITFFDAAAANGDLVGTGVSLALKNDRREAVRHQILLAGDLIKQSTPVSTVCKQLSATLIRIDTDNNVDANDYVTGTAGDDLAQKIKDLRASLGC